MDVKYENDRIREITKVVLGDKEDTRRIMIWSREDGFLGPEGKPESESEESGLTTFEYVKR